jgi:hypothetical protein
MTLALRRLLARMVAIVATSIEANAEPIPAHAPSGLEPLREFYLRGIHVLRDYRPGKNSFVEGPDR